LSLLAGGQHGALGGKNLADDATHLAPGSRKVQPAEFGDVDRLDQCPEYLFLQVDVFDGTFRRRHPTHAALWCR